MIAKELAKLPSAQPEPCEDAVSRQRLLTDLKELIAAWKKYPVMAEQIKGVEAAIGYVELIPSVKPDSKELSSTHKALDTISRQAAIDITWEEPSYTDALNVLTEIRDKIKALPTAQPEPEDCDTCKHGYFGDEECNNCRVRFPSHYERRTDEQTISE